MSRNYDPIGKQLEESFNNIESACLVADIAVESSNDIYTDSMKKFIRLLVYCGDHHLYTVRECALKKILRDL